jgi:hypothetical protein
MSTLPRTHRRRNPRDSEPRFIRGAAPDTALSALFFPCLFKAL